jgi:cell division protein FtsB
LDFNFKLSNSVWSTITAIGIALVSPSLIVRNILKRLLNILAKPLYDWVLRKGYIQIKKVEAKEAQTNLENAKTKEEIKKAIDEIP